MKGELPRPILLVEVRKSNSNWRSSVPSLLADSIFSTVSATNVLTLQGASHTV